MGNSSSSSHKVSNGRDSKSSKKNGHNMSGNQGTADAMMQAQLEAEQNLAYLAQIKERRRLELLAFEEEQAKKMSEEAQLKNTSDINRDKFLSHITVVQKQLEDQIAQVHQLQEAARSKFSEDLTKSEAEMEASITAVLQDIRAHRDQAQLQELVKAEEQQTSTLLALKMEEFKNLRKADILDAMKLQLEQDMTRNKTESLLLTTVTLEDEEKSRQVEAILQHRQKDQASLVAKLLMEETWQCQAFAWLLSQRDRRTAQLAADIQSVVEQLNELTNWELQRREQRQEITTTALADNRLALAELLASLLEQQQARRKDLKHLLEEMEAQRQHQAADYWLVQYQRLIDSMPESVLANVEQLGKLNGHQRLKQEPSAPPMSLSDTFVNDVEPSAPTDVFAETTCVVCLDSLCQSIFLPCGHLCTCNKCSQTIDQCPMCRASIRQRLQVHS